jgi:hypothetical protein
MRLATLLVATALCFSALAIEPPETRAGRPAIKRYAAAKAKLDADYQARLTGLQRQLAVDLRAAIKVATRNGDLADAQALQEYLDKLVGRTYTFQIDAAKDWQPTIEVKKGQKISIEAEGEWCANTSEGAKATCTADGLMHPVLRKEVWYLEGRIGEGVAERLDTACEFVASEDGVLRLRMNDTDHSDNSGELYVTVSVR